MVSKETRNNNFFVVSPLAYCMISWILHRATILANNLKHLFSSSNVLMRSKSIKYTSKLTLSFMIDLLKWSSKIAIVQMNWKLSCSPSLHSKTCARLNEKEYALVMNHKSLKIKVCMWSSSCSHDWIKYRKKWVKWDGVL